MLRTKPLSRKTSAIVFALAAAMATVAAQPGTAPIKEDWKQYLPPGPAKPLVETRCGVCHELRTVVGLRKTEAGWRMVIEDMVNRGAPLVPEEEQQITTYLGAVFGPDAPPLTDVNAARQTDLIKLPGITSALADRLIAHRMTNPFSSRDEVKSVTGLDEAAFDRIRWYLQPSGKAAQPAQGITAGPTRSPDQRP